MGIADGIQTAVRGHLIRIQFNIRFVLVAVALVAIVLAMFVEREQLLDSVTIKTEDGAYFVQVSRVKHSTLIRSRLTVKGYIGRTSDQQYLCGHTSKIGPPYTSSGTPVSLDDDSEFLPRWIPHASLPNAIYARYWITESESMEVGVLPTKNGYIALGGRCPLG